MSKNKVVIVVKIYLRKKKQVLQKIKYLLNLSAQFPFQILKKERRDSKKEEKRFILASLKEIRHREKLNRYGIYIQIGFQVSV